jgi:hypothetical protein
MQNIGGKADNVCPPKWSHSLQFYLGKGILFITLSHQSLLFSFLLFINHNQSTATQAKAEAEAPNSNSQHQVKRQTPMSNGMMKGENNAGQKRREE